MSFPIELIPDTDKLFYRIHTQYIDYTESDAKKKIKPGAFDPIPKPDGTEMSVDWSKYSTSIETQNRARKPERVGVVSFVVGEVRSQPTLLKVEHRPTLNQAHSIIFDVLPNANNPEIRINLRRICQWEIEI